MCATLIRPNVMTWTQASIFAVPRHLRLNIGGEILRKYFASYFELVQFFEAFDHVLFEFCESFDS
jgi:hypothetical protein